jgi:hypothetical protein
MSIKSLSLNAFTAYFILSHSGLMDVLS